MKERKERKRGVMIENFRFFFPLIGKLSPFAPLVCILRSLFETCIMLIMLYLPKTVIEEMMYLRENNFTFNRELLMMILGMLCASCLLVIVNHILTLYIDLIAFRVDLHIDRMLNDKLSEIDYFRLEDPQFTDKLRQALEGMRSHTSGLREVVNAFINIMTSVLSCIGSLVIIILHRQYIIFLFVLISVVVTLIGNIFQDANNFKMNQKRVRYMSKTFYFAQTVYDLRTQKNLRLYDVQPLLREKTDRFIDGYYRIHRNYARKNVSLETMILATSVFAQFFVLLVLGWGLFKEHDTTITIAVIILLLSTAESLRWDVSNAIGEIVHYKKSCEYQRFFIEIMEMKSVNKAGTIPIKELKSIEFRNVSFRYPRTDKYILKNVNFKIEGKDKISLVGLNGAGKTTLIKLLCRFYEIEEGEILVNGENIIHYDYEDYMKLISVVFQDFYIISFNIKNNIAILDENKEKLYDCFRRAQVLDLIESLPRKEYTYINKWFDRSGVAFSGGEMQKFAFARSLYKESDFAILDEPTSALDPVAESEIYYHFKEIVGEKMTLFISHRLSGCRFSDRILVIDGAKIAEEGTHEELMKNTDGLYHRMFTEQAKYYK